MKIFLLFLNFCLIITSYYQIKPASRTLFITYLGTETLPYLWIASTVTLAIFLLFFYQLIRVVRRYLLMNFLNYALIILLIIFYFILQSPTKLSVFLFYILVDISGVFLVENFWSLTNSTFHTSEGKRYYGMLAAGGLLGGIIGSGLAALLISHWGLHTVDLLLVSAILLLPLPFIHSILFSRGYLKEIFEGRISYTNEENKKNVLAFFKLLVQKKYLLLLTFLILLPQLIEPIIEYQFLHILENSIHQLKDRTAYLSSFFFVLSSLALVINILLTPLIHKIGGVIGGLFTQPIVILFSTFAFLLSPVLPIAALLKISDRALSYSINRASKELLYAPFEPETIFTLKAWIDMFGYRFFKIFGSLSIIFFVQFLHFRTIDLSWIVIVICCLWIGLVLSIKRYTFHV